MDHHRFNLARIERALQAPAAPSSDFDFDPVPPPPASGLRAAAVLVPLVERGTGLRVILTRRAARLRHHPGQIAFPGGKRDPSDPSDLDAALREADEEIGLAPTQVEVLGSFDPHRTVTQFTITPFVGLVPGDFTPVPDPAEVEEVFEVPLGFLLDPANFQTHARTWQGRLRRYPVIPYGPHYIWGATARMLRSLAARMQDP